MSGNGEKEDYKQEEGCKREEGCKEGGGAEERLGCKEVVGRGLVSAFDLTLAAVTLTASGAALGILFMAYKAMKLAHNHPLAAFLATGVAAAWTLT